MISGFNLALGPRVNDRDLRELARLYGVQLSYEDASGKTRKATPEQLRAILRVRVRDGMSLDDALKFRRTHMPRREKIAAPERAPSPTQKIWGIFVPIYAMHQPDLTGMQHYQQWVRELGGAFVATLPLNALDDDERSPYSPTSRLFWNELYLDVTRLPEYRGEKSDDKRALLKKLSQRWMPPNDVDPLLRAYAEFRAAHAIPSVSEELGGEGGAKKRNLRTARPTRSLADARDDFTYHLYVQLRMSEQMSDLESMYLDFPLGVKAGGFDNTQFAGHFAKGVSVGAPPDLFFTKGQNWGFPPPEPDADHSYFRACIRKAVQHASILRIDHVMGLHRLFWIPDGAEPKDGVYVRYPAEELYAVLMSEAQRTGTVIVGEDLGTVPKYVPQAMNRHGIRRMYVVQYELPKLDGPQRESIASINTHDMPTFAGFWQGKDIDERVERDLLDKK
ncbi:MAG TPA: 4-alpha-glucanotransferase, partial [Thermoanaerobaculia bacterium]|nr:4-alpha-glucanotransferase [Thermoanaerobaculia bacterium]